MSSALERFIIDIDGHCYSHTLTNERGFDTKYYGFKCPTHGYVKSRTYGYKEILRCPQCMHEIITGELVDVGKREPSYLVVV